MHTMTLFIWVLCVMPALGLHVHHADRLDHAGHGHGETVEVHIALLDLCDSGLCHFEPEPHSGDLYLPLAGGKVMATAGLSDSPVLPAFDPRLPLAPSQSTVHIAPLTDFHPLPGRFRQPLNRAPPHASPV